MLYALHTWLAREADPFHLGLLAGTGAVLVVALWLAAAGVPMAWCLLVVTLASAVTVVGDEAVGHRHLAASLNRSLSGTKAAELLASERPVKWLFTCFRGWSSAG